MRVERRAKGRLIAGGRSTKGGGSGQRYGRRPNQRERQLTKAGNPAWPENTVRDVTVFASTHARPISVP